MRPVSADTSSPATTAALNRPPAASRRHRDERVRRSRLTTGTAIADHRARSDDADVDGDVRRAQKQTHWQRYRSSLSRGRQPMRRASSRSLSIRKVLEAVGGYLKPRGPMPVHLRVQEAQPAPLRRRNRPQLASRNLHARRASFVLAPPRQSITTWTCPRIGDSKARGTALPGMRRSVSTPSTSSGRTAMGNDAKGGRIRPSALRLTRRITECRPAYAPITATESRRDAAADRSSGVHAAPDTACRP